jgi:RNA polymerase sigma factor (sigma-70 family)
VPGEELAAPVELSDAESEELAALDAALDTLQRVAERQARVVECRFFGGLSIEETAVALDVSPRTVKRDWTFARAWLRREMQRAPATAASGRDG